MDGRSRGGGSSLGMAFSGETPLLLGVGIPGATRRRSLSALEGAVDLDGTQLYCPMGRIQMFRKRTGLPWSCSPMGPRPEYGLYGSLT